MKDYINFKTIGATILVVKFLFKAKLISYKFASRTINNLALARCKYRSIIEKESEKKLKKLEGK